MRRVYSSGLREEYDAISHLARLKHSDNCVIYAPRSPGCILWGCVAPVASSTLSIHRVSADSSGRMFSTVLSSATPDNIYQPIGVIVRQPLTAIPRDFRRDERQPRMVYYTFENEETDCIHCARESKPDQVWKHARDRLTMITHDEIVWCGNTVYLLLPQPFPVVDGSFWNSVIPEMYAESSWLALLYESVCKWAVSFPCPGLNSRNSRNLHDDYGSRVLGSTSVAAMGDGDWGCAAG